MKIRSICPSCGQRLSRWWYLKCVPHRHHLCPQCSATIKSNNKWEWIGSSTLGIPSGTSLSLAIFGFLSWPIAIGVILALLATGWVIFPFITLFDLVKDPNGYSIKQEDGS